MVTVQPCGGPFSTETTAFRFWTCEPMGVPDNAYSSANCEKFVVSNQPKIMVLYEVGASTDIRPCEYESCQHRQLVAVTEKTNGSAETHQIITTKIMQVRIDDNNHALIGLSNTVDQR